MGVRAPGQASSKIASPPPKGMADTPELLADAAIRVVGLTGATSWLDPSAGSGQLIKAALRAGVSADAILAVDLQTKLPALERLGVESLLGTDFLQWARKTERRFDRVIANPPFVRLRELHEALFRPAIETRLDGVSIPAMANYWVAFMVAGMRLLGPGGSLAYILPAAWEYADYASALRNLCEDSFEELDVHRVSMPMFDEVNDGSVLLVGRGFGKRPSRQAQVIRHPTLMALNQAVCADDTRHTVVSEMRQQEASLQDDQVRVGQIAQIGIGAVTGDAHYFLLNEAQRIELGLPKSVVRPILSKAAHIIKSEIDRGAWVSLLKGGKRVWLFDPSEADILEPSVRDYLDLAVEDGGCRRVATKIKNREPWYRVPVPEAFDGFATGMSHNIPWIALNRMPGLTASNTLYGVRFLSVRSIDEQAAWCLSMLSSATTQSRARLVREYPQGLWKLEPRDLAALPLRRPKTTDGARSLYRRAVDLIISGRREVAQAMVDDWLN